MSNSRGSPRRVIRVERGRRVVFGGIALVSGVVGLGGLVDQIQTQRVDGFQSFLSVLFLALAFWCVGLASMQLGMDGEGLDIRDSLFRHHRLSWDEIERFEISQPGHQAFIVRRDGGRVPLLGFAVSPLERRRASPAPAERLTEELNDALNQHRVHGGND